ncbi:hypothetical protein LTR95_006389 [Oleoguttula sp. CCFEE 5521]
MPTATKLSSSEVAKLVELSAQQMELLTTLMGVAHEKHALEMENEKLKTQIDLLKIMLQSKHSMETALRECVRRSLSEDNAAHVSLCAQVETQLLIGMTSDFDDEALAASVTTILRETSVDDWSRKLRKPMNADGEGCGAPRVRTARGS